MFWRKEIKGKPYTFALNLQLAPHLSFKTHSVFFFIKFNNRNSRLKLLLPHDEGLFFALLPCFLLLVLTFFLLLTTHLLKYQLSEFGRVPRLPLDASFFLALEDFSCCSRISFRCLSMIFRRKLVSCFCASINCYVSFRYFSTSSLLDLRGWDRIS